MSSLSIQKEYDETASLLRKELVEYVQSLHSPIQVIDRLNKVYYCPSVATIFCS